MHASSRQLRTPTQVQHVVQQTVIGQDAAIKAVTTAIYFHQFTLNAQRRDPQRVFASGPRNNLVLAGPSGCGKTLIVQTAAKVAGVPSVMFDATRLTQVGYVGANPEEIVHEALTAAGGDPVLAERSVIILDEFDKLARKESGVRDISGEGVQQGLLKLVEGRMFSGPGKSTTQIFTGNMLWVFCGAFTGVEQLIETRLRDEARGNPPAFLDELPDDDLDLDGRARRRVLWQHFGTADLARFGIIPEFCGRLSSIAWVEELDVEALLRVLRDSQQSILKQRTLEFALHGIDLEFTPDALRAIAERVVAEGGGARGLTRELNRVLGPWRSQAPDLRQRGVNKVIVTRATVTRAAEPYLKEGPPLAAGAGFEELLTLPEPAPLATQSAVLKVEFLPAPRFGPKSAAMELVSAEQKERVGWWSATEEARLSFREVLRKNPCSSEALLGFLNDMVAFLPPITFDELRAARIQGETTHLQALLAFAVYLRSRHRNNAM